MYIDLVNRIKNAQEAGKKIVRAPYSNMDKEIASLLLKRGFVSKVNIVGRGADKVIKIYLRPSAVSGFDFASKPSIQRYTGWKDIRPVKSGYGMLVLSTPKGIMSGEDARKEKVGGKVLFKIW
ncbi:MAG: 30S ribosomal protein S8 [Candidatus Omnitrophota bacterium]|nr:MAG: 30S ribosomal protein S8 [Candidatus Omnitrophota bacterium]